ncbi:unnamed protein product [Prorocentrum cordatum]|uniref:Uncharacterized protein n=1 Tax=Prorocentrum cordatum TaxID=2364126 RepID=A0ABN9R0F7_9DINO|nr:unnamed protein product [Polarella glacialis]
MVPEAAAGAVGGVAGLAEAAEAKEAGNAALRSADLPLAVERYEEAIAACDRALAALEGQRRTEPKELANDDLVYYEHQGREGFGIVDMAHPHFGDYVVKDLGTADIVKVKAGKYEEVSRRFRRRELVAVPRELFDTRLACLNNLTLVSLKLAKSTLRDEDFVATVKRADDALAMDGRAAKALMRKGASLLVLKQVKEAVQALTLASHVTRGKDSEVERLLEAVMVAKGKSRGKGRGKRKGEDEGDGSGEAAGRRSPSPCSYSSSSDAPAEAPRPAGRDGDAEEADDDGEEPLIEELPRGPGGSGGEEALAAAAALALAAAAAALWGPGLWRALALDGEAPELEVEL